MELLACGRRLVAALVLLGSAGVAEAEPLRVGTISEAPREDVEEFLPLARYLETRLDGAGYDGVELVMLPTIERMTEAMRDGAIDVFVDSPMPSLAVNARSGGRMALRRWKDGVAEYRSVVFARAGGEVRSVGDLRGRLVAMEDPFSSSGHLLPRLALLREGLDLAALDDPRAPVPEGRVGYAFSGDDENTVQWVLRDRAAAGAMSEDDLAELQREHGVEFDVVFASPTVPRHVVNLAPGVSAEAERALVAILTGMDDTPEGLAALRAFEETARFDPIPPDALAFLDEVAAGLNEIVP